VLTKFLAALVLIISIAGYWLWTEYNSALTTPVVTDNTHILEIKKGDNFQKISNKLLEQGIAIKPLWFKFIAQQNKVSHKLKAGEFELKAGLTMPEILTILTKGKSRQYSITFPEGWSFKQIIQQVHKNKYLVKTLDSNDFQEVMEKVGSKQQHPEGMFFPETYYFEKNTTDLTLLKRAHRKMQAVLDEEWKNKEAGLPLDTPYKTLILASIIEKETGAKIERPEISGVFTRRLRKGMRLQTDPTVIYGMGDNYKGNIRYKDLRQATPYNTYVINGLPPTPIAMPGQAAIHAALHPTKGKTLYFVAKGDGSGTHYFSSSLKEHNNAVNKYQRKR
jgi:UPF0755 protein